MLDSARWWQLVLAGGMMVLAGCPAEKTPPAPPPAKDAAQAAKVPSTSDVATPVATAEKQADPQPATVPAAMPAKTDATAVVEIAAKPEPVAVDKPAAPATGRGDKHAKVDPIKVNGPIFEGWTRPQAALVITGEQLGYMEPCGCAGLENQKGGLSRRYTLFEQLRPRAGRSCRSIWAASRIASASRLKSSFRPPSKP